MESRYTSYFDELIAAVERAAAPPYSDVIELLTPLFLRSRTPFGNMEVLLTAAGMSFEERRRVRSIADMNTPAVNHILRQRTRFAGGVVEMAREALTERIRRDLGE